MRFKRISLSLATVLALLAAVPADAQTERRTFQAGYDRTWSATVATLEQYRVPIVNSDKTTGFIRISARFVPQSSNHWVDQYTTQTVRALSGWLDVQLDQTLTFVRRGSDSTELKIETGIAVWNAWTEIWRTLPSSGSLEREAFEAIQARLDSPGTEGSQGQGEDGTLSLSSKPDKSEIEVDGAFIGQTSAKLTLAPGRHTIRVTKKGFQEWTRTVQILPGSATALEIELVK